MVPSSNKMPNQHLAFIGAVIAGIVILLAIIMSSLFKPLGIFKTYGQGYKDGFNKARNIAVSELHTQALTGQVMELSGTVVSVASDHLVIKPLGVFLDSSVDGVSETRTVIVTGDTVIDRIESATDDQKKPPTDQPKSAPAVNPIKLNQVKAGDMIVVQSMNHENILLQSSFKASAIHVGTMAVTKSRFEGEEKPTSTPRNLRETTE
jgi:hypothetical protein